LDIKKPKILPFPKKGIAQTPGSASIIDVNASFGSRLASLSESDLRTAVSRIILYGTYRETRHSAEDRSYRNVSDDDIQFMLRGPWTLKGPPEWDEMHRNWKYKLSGQDIEGDELVLLLAVNEEEQMITVITKY
jgi:hypothetical protein